jgi:hypothetical protein
MLVVVVMAGVIVLDEEDEVDVGSPVDVVVEDDAEDVLLEDVTGGSGSHTFPRPSLSVSL